MSGYPHCPHCSPGCKAEHLIPCAQCKQSHADYGKRRRQR